MRLLLLITSFFFSCLSFGQDSLKLDTPNKRLSSVVNDSLIIDSTTPALKDSATKKKKQKKKVKKSKLREEPFVSKTLAKDVEAPGNNDGLIIIGLIIIAALVYFAYSRSYFSRTYGQSTTGSEDDDEFISDYLSRILLSRREYYRNVYLKSEAWKRKRYLVLKRDNWRCVYCGGQATEVHHKRYAKINIGKEPIEWLVSVCRTCHDSKH